jgi:hypothetical protein
MCAPEATGGLTVAAAAVEVMFVFAALFVVEWPITQPTTPAGISSAKKRRKIAPSITGVGTLRFDIRANIRHERRR